MIHPPPLISIITVSLNSSEFIEQTIQSVISQTYPHKEYIIIDGGSTDGTVEIIRKYQSHLAYWHSRPDRGLAHAFNLGFEHSHGDWIIYLHADDFFLEPAVLDKMAPHLAAHDRADVVIGQVIKMLRQKDPQPLPLFCPHATPWRWRQYRRLCTMPHQAAFIRRRYFDRMGPFDESFKIALDYDLFLRAGKDLRCPYVPIAVSGMRDGGIGARNILKTLREAQRAQLKNKTIPAWFAWMNLYAIFAHWLVSWAGHKALDRFEDVIIGPDKSIKNKNQSISLIFLNKLWSDIRSLFLVRHVT